MHACTYCANWVDRFADNSRELATTKYFPLTCEALNSFELLKTGLENVAQNSDDVTARSPGRCSQTSNTTDIQKLVLLTSIVL